MAENHRVFNQGMRTDQNLYAARTQGCIDFRTLLLAGRTSQQSYIDPQRGHLVRNGGIVLLSQNRSEEHTSELQSRPHLVCSLLLEKKKLRRKGHLAHAR